MYVRLLNQISDEFFAKKGDTCTRLPLPISSFRSAELNLFADILEQYLRRLLGLSYSLSMSGWTISCLKLLLETKAWPPILLLLTDVAPNVGCPD